MLTTYLICLLSGGALVLVSIFLGGDTDTDVHADLDAHFDMDSDMDAHVDMDIHGVNELSGNSNVSVAAEIWLPFFSLRFWIFATAFFGLTGTLLSFLQILSSDSMIVIISSIMGIVAGLAMAYLMRFMQNKEVNSTILPKEYVGRTAKVIVPISADALGKIRLTINNTEIDMIATTDEERAFERGDSAFVISVHLKDGMARVVRKFGELESPTKNSLLKGE